jgi:hypothetical protein
MSGAIIRWVCRIVYKKSSYWIFFLCVCKQIRHTSKAALLSYTMSVLCCWMMISFRQNFYVTNLYPTHVWKYNSINSNELALLSVKLEVWWHSEKVLVLNNIQHLSGLDFCAESDCCLTVEETSSRHRRKWLQGFHLWRSQQHSKLTVLNY